jgi:hypothetical protein
MKKADIAALLGAMGLIVGAIFFLGEKSDVIESRVLSVTDVTVLSGLGPEDTILEMDDFVAGDMIYVLEIKGEWLRFRVSEKDFGWSGWIARSATAKAKK